MERGKPKKATTAMTVIQIIPVHPIRKRNKENKLKRDASRHIEDEMGVGNPNSAIVIIIPRWIGKATTTMMTTIMMMGAEQKRRNGKRIDCESNKENLTTIIQKIIFLPILSVGQCQEQIRTDLQKTRDVSPWED